MLMIVNSGKHDPYDRTADNQWLSGFIRDNHATRSRQPEKAARVVRVAFFEFNNIYIH